MTGQGTLAGAITIGGFKWTGDFTTIDLIAASTNALNGALLPAGPTITRTSRSSASC